ncbi:MAG TPA: methyltransferase [Caulobacteraceae bacterium]
MKVSVLAAAALLALASSGALAAGAPSFVANAVADPARPAEDRADDALRDPADTLAFAGVRPGMVVGELFPGGGYYTLMLSDVVGPTGMVHGLENAGWKEAVKADERLVAQPGRANVTLDIEPFGQFRLPGKIDLFWITQNYHDLHIAKYGAVDMAAFNRHVFESLRPGGVYFILDHQANPGVTPEQIAVLHRIDKARVIAEVTAAGFKLADEGDFLRRPGDDHLKTIFDPAIRGHTDQYALKFVKP